MALIQINRQPTRRQLTQFAVAWLVFFLLLAGLLAWREVAQGLGWAVAALALLGPALGIGCRPGLRRLYLGMCYAAWPLGMLISHLILLLIYALILTPTGLLLRVAKRGFFPKRPDSTVASYWLRCKPPRPVKDYFKPY